MLTKSSAQLKLGTTSSKLATQLPGLLSQPAVAGAGCLDELQQRIYWHLVMKWLKIATTGWELETSSDQLQLATHLLARLC